MPPAGLGLPERHHAPGRPPCARDAALTTRFSSGGGRAFSRSRESQLGCLETEGPLPPVMTGGRGALAASPNAPLLGQPPSLHRAPHSPGGEEGQPSAALLNPQATWNVFLAPGAAVTGRLPGGDAPVFRRGEAASAGEATGTTGTLLRAIQHACPAARTAGGEEGPGPRWPAPRGAQGAWLEEARRGAALEGVNLPGWGKGSARPEGPPAQNVEKWNTTVLSGRGCVGPGRGPGSARAWARRREPPALPPGACSWRPVPLPRHLAHRVWTKRSVGRDEGWL